MPSQILHYLDSEYIDILFDIALEFGNFAYKLYRNIDFD